MIIYISLFLLFLLSCIVFPLQPSFFETPKIILAEVAVDILFFLWIFKSKTSLNYKKLLPFFLVFVLTLIDIIFFRNTFTLFGNPFRLQGVLLLWHLLLWACISSAIVLPSFTWIVALMAGLLLSISVIFFGKNDAGRFVGFLGDPNMLAAAGIFIWPFFFFAKKIHPWIKVSALIFMSMLLVLTFSRSALIAFAIQLFFIGLLAIKRMRIQFALALCVLVMLVSMILPFLDTHRVWENRSEIWQTAFQAGLVQPIIGSGFGNVENEISAQADRMSNTLRYEYVDSSHNIFLDWWIAGGAIGILLLFWLIGQAGIRFTTEKNVRNSVLLLGVVTCLLFNPASIVLLIQFWWVVGQGARHTV